CRLHTGPDHVHMPALPAKALIHYTLCLLRDAVLVLAPDAGISAKAECLVEPVVECGLFKEMYGPVHPEDKIAEVRMEIVGDIIRPKCPVARDPVKANQQRRCVFSYHPPGLFR